MKQVLCIIPLCFVMSFTTAFATEERSPSSRQDPAGLSIEIRGQNAPRLRYASQRLRENLCTFGAARIILSSDKLDRVEGDRTPEGFHLYRDAEGAYRIEGYGDSGTL